MKNFLVPFLFLVFTSSFAQKKIIDHTVYNAWKRVGDVKISPNGNFSVYTIKPHRGDGFLYIVNHQTGKKDSIARGVNPVFSSQNEFVAFKINPGFDTLRKCELNKVKKDKWPKDSLAIFLFNNDSLVKIPKVKSFYVPEKGNAVIYFQDGNKLPEGKTKKKWFQTFRKKKKNEVSYESDGNVLVHFVPATGKSIKTKDVKSVELATKSDYFLYTKHQKVKVDSFQLILGNNASHTLWTIPSKYNHIGDIAFNSNATAFTFTASMDTADRKLYKLFYADIAQKKVTQLLDTVIAGVDASMALSEYVEPYFSENGNRIFLGLSKKPRLEVKDSLLESEKVKLDIWHWKDDRLQPQQLLEVNEDKKLSTFAYYDLNSNKLQVLANDTLEVRVLNKGNSNFALAFSVEAYQSSYNWEYPNKRDVYRINLETAQKELLKKGVIYSASLSPSGKYFYYFNAENQQQYIKDLESGKENCLTCSTAENWNEDINGQPIIAEPLGMLGWLPNESGLLIQSHYDVWKYEFSNGKITALTDGKSSKTRFRIFEWDRDSTFIHFENCFLTGFHELDKSMSLHKPSRVDGQWKFEMQFRSNHDLTGFRKAKNGSTYLFQKGSLQDYPDVYSNNWDQMETSKRLSITNPQQSEYNWATVELVDWKAYDGTALQGLLYKPENYDSTKKYPLLVYFYELYSDELHNHYAPRPTASIIFPTEYASAGYFVLIPDIRYKPGYPAAGAYNAIMSGTDHVLRKYKSIDSTHMGLQGQSWGGYQTAQLITMTMRYKAAMAGAPVGNMFSAYGGIRWGSGLNRQFQYERTQSRIGKTIWEAPELYTANSPVFHLPKVQTPLLIMHNDQDGAVPWYQGIELFTGLKRLNKPVWMLNYNGDDHNLMKNPNRMDLSIRMRQFFDHYLQGKPAPIWLKSGIPAIEKGINDGLGYE